MTIEDIATIGLPIEDPTTETVLYVEAALDWLTANTTLEFDVNNIESLKALPSGAKLFISKFGDVAGRDITVASESLGGMSQSFTSSSQYNNLMSLAQGLISPYLKSAFSFISAKQRWR